MRVCLFLEGQEGVRREQYLALAHAAEAAGLDGLFRSDHYRSVALSDPAGSLEAGSLEAWATLAALAARTERLRLGTSQSGAPPDDHENTSTGIRLACARGTFTKNETEVTPRCQLPSVSCCASGG